MNVRDKYAELGIIAEQTKRSMCKHDYDSFGCKHTRDFVICGWVQFCQKEAELLAEVEN